MRIQTLTALLFFASVFVFSAYGEKNTDLYSGTKLSAKPNEALENLQQLIHLNKSKIENFQKADNEEVFTEKKTILFGLANRINKQINFNKLKEDPYLQGLFSANEDIKAFINLFSEENLNFSFLGQIIYSKKENMEKRIKKEKTFKSLFDFAGYVSDDIMKKNIENDKAREFASGYSVAVYFLYAMSQFLDGKMDEKEVLRVFREIYISDLNKPLNQFGTLKKN